MKLPLFNKRRKCGHTTFEPDAKCHHCHMLENCQRSNEKERRMEARLPEMYLRLPESLKRIVEMEIEEGI